MRTETHLQPATDHAGELVFMYWVHSSCLACNPGICNAAAHTATGSFVCYDSPVLPHIDWNAELKGSRLAAEWGQERAFPSLQNLSLSWNSNLGGTLPDWGADKTGLQKLRHLELQQTSLAGAQAWKARLVGRPVPFSVASAVQLT